MSQADPTAYVDSESGTAHVSRHNTVAAAFLSMHSGGSRPSYAAAGTLWRDSDTPSATVQTLFLYDGTDDIGLMQVDITNNYIAKLGIGIVPSGMAAGTAFHAKTGASGASVDGGYDDFVFEFGALGGISLLGAAATRIGINFGTSADATGANIKWDDTTMGIGTSKSGGVVNFTTGDSADCMLLSGLKVLIGDTSDANVTQGITTNQGASDDFFSTGKSSDVATGMTDEAETDTMYGLKKQAGASGGVTLYGLSEDDSGVRIYGYVTTDNTTHTTAGGGSVAVPRCCIEAVEALPLLRLEERVGENCACDACR